MDHPITKANAREFRNNCLGLIVVVILVVLGFWDPLIEPLIGALTK